MREAWMRALLAILVWTGATGCVVHYDTAPEAAAPAEPLAPPVDFGEVLQRLESMVAATDQIDQRDRLLAARDLARRMQTLDPKSQQTALAYLQKVVSIEERARPVMAPAFYEDQTVATFSAVANVEEETLGSPASPDIETPEESPANKEDQVEAPQTSTPEPEPTPQDTPVAAPPVAIPDQTTPTGSPAIDETPEADQTPPPTEPDAGAPSLQAPTQASSNETAVTAESAQARAQAAMARGDAISAMDALAACKNHDCWPAVERAWYDARESYIQVRRKEAGDLYRASRETTQSGERLEKLTQARAILADLMDRFPRSPYGAQLYRNLEMVQREIDQERENQSEPTSE
ncbi:MAG: hypothetical protein QGG40_01100 [Myxococcota bacterium]|jgi:hypothetical protein|nr:hypothetical protein [Myxococcota bacterium]